MSLARRLIQGTDFRRFLDFVTPAFFDVMPARGLFSTATNLVRDYRNGSGFDTAVRHRQGRVQALNLLAELNETRGYQPKGRIADLDEAQRKEVGHAVLELYFHQLFDEDGSTLLNLSSDRFHHDGERVIWTPTRGHIQWPEGFRRALANVYLAFYREGGPSLAEALDALNLAPTADIFIKHFGEGDQRSVRFRVRNFVDSFHRVFLCCKENGIRLDPNFLALGIYLATLYDALEAVDVPLDVRAAFDRVASGMDTVAA